MRKRRLWIFGLLTTMVLACTVSAFVVNEPRPSRGRTGAEAEQLTQALERTARVDAWARTGAVAFEWVGRHRYLWDRTRHLIRVRWSDIEVQLPLDGGRAIIRRGGRDVGDHQERVALRDEALAFFFNDSFWLNPFEKLRDAAATRSAIRRHGHEALLVEYASGGATPGDAYVFMPAERGKPVRWAMFVQVLPIGGVENTWESWVTLSTGARVARRHGNGRISFQLVSNVRGAATLAELEPDGDPFAELMQGLAPALAPAAR